MTTLADIRTKVRRLTGRPSVQQITDAQIDDYVNTFYLYDMPETIRLFSLETNFSFLCTPFVDQYPLADLQVEVAGGALESALDVYYNLEPPFYVAGLQGMFYQDQTQFYAAWPKLAVITTSLIGDGTTGPYSFTLPDVPIYQNLVSIGATDNTGAEIKIMDSPTSSTIGSWVIENTSTAVTGSINYQTGVGTVTFSNGIPSGNVITISSVPYAAARPIAALFFDNVITLRPGPDKPYEVTFQAFMLPTALLSSASSPRLKQWWQYLAFGAARKIFQDSQDPEGEAQVLPAFREQERLVLRRTLGQTRSKRAATIYSEDYAGSFGNYYPTRF